MFDNSAPMLPLTNRNNNQPHPCNKKLKYTIRMNNFRILLHLADANRNHSDQSEDSLQPPFRTVIRVTERFTA